MSEFKTEEVKLQANQPEAYQAVRTLVAYTNALQSDITRLENQLQSAKNDLEYIRTLFTF